MSLEEEAKDLLYFFARFEYSLKENRYVLDKKGRAAPDWNKFKQSLNKQSVVSLYETDSDIIFLMNDPPKKQQYINKTLSWSSSDKIASMKHIERLIDSSLTIRNNLVHGGKMNDPDDERNLKLLRAARKILEAALAADENLKMEFDKARIQIK